MKNKSIYLSLFLLLLFGCKKETSPTQITTNDQLSITRVVDSVQFTLSVQSLTFNIGDTLKAEYTLTNRGKAIRIFQFPTEEQFYWVLDYDWGGNVMYQPVQIHHTPTQLSLEPNKFVTYLINQKIDTTATSGKFVILANLHPDIVSLGRAPISQIDIFLK